MSRMEGRIRIIGTGSGSQMSAVCRGKLVRDSVVIHPTFSIFMKFGWRNKRISVDDLLIGLILE